MTRRDAQAAAGPTQLTSGNTPDAAALCAAGLRHFEAGQVLEAQVCCREALALDPGHADTMHLMGLTSLQAGQHDLALEWFSRAIRQDPQPRFLLSLGNVLRQQGRHEDALQVYDKAVQLAPGATESWKHLIDLLIALKRLDEAQLGLEQVMKLAPDDWDAAMKRAALLIKLGRPIEAIACFDHCERLRPDHAPTLQMRAFALHNLNRFEESLADIERAFTLDPGNADSANTAGVLLRRLGRGEESIAWFDKAIALKPDFVTPYQNKGFALGHLHRFAEAFATYDALHAIDPDNAEGEWSAALLHLLTGNFRDGWRGREVRFRVPGLAFTHFPFAQPLWLGQVPVAGKTVLIHVDEGLGDTIQFARYVPMVAALGARVILLVDAPLHQLLARLPGVSKCLPLSTTEIVDFDMYCPISSLPLAFGTTLDTIPARVPYLPAPKHEQIDAWNTRLGPRDKLRIGLTWSGNPQHKDDHNRSLPLRALEPLLACDATFVSLQKYPRPNDRAMMRERPDIIDLTEHLTDFDETAALLSRLDLVITVDTSVAHLAGALACPTWILLPYTPDYRWLLDREDSPWYPTARLFRQDESRDYTNVIARMACELQAKIAARSQER